MELQGSQRPRTPNWDVLVDVYENALRELAALDDPRVQPLVDELSSLYGQALLEKHAHQVH